jgi:ABC-type dipeptide/oligopeptide/nickel transport system permease component
MLDVISGTDRRQALYRHGLRTALVPMAPLFTVVFVLPARV